MAIQAIAPLTTNALRAPIAPASPGLAPLALPQRRQTAQNTTSFRRPNTLPTPANDENSPVNDSKKDSSEIELLESIEVNTSKQLGIDQEIEKITSELVGKLSVLSERLNSKYAIENDGQPIQAESPTSEALAENENNPQQTDGFPQPLEPLRPKKEKPSSELIENKKSGKELESTKKNPVADGLTAVGGFINKGFKTAKSGLDKITGFLFKMSVSQAVEAAKIGFAIFSIIAGIDLIRIYWAKWGEDIKAKLSEWAEIFKGWWDTFTDWASQFSSFTSAFETMGANLMAIRNAWENGDFPALASAIGGAILDLASRIAATIGRVVASVISAALRKFGFDGVADDIDAGAIRFQQSVTDNRLSPEEQKKLAENQVKKEQEDGKTATERGVTDFLPNSWRNKLGILSDDEMKQIDTERKDMDSRKHLSKDDQVKTIAASNEAKNAIERYKKFADNANPSNKNDMEKVNKYKSEAQEYLNNKNLDLQPKTKQELQTQFNAIKVKQTSVTPESAKESKDSQTVNSIKQIDANKAKEKQTEKATANIQNNIVKKSTNVNVHAPITNTNAPGIHKSTGVN